MFSVPVPLNLPIRTERLVLRAARAEDVDDLHRYMSDPDVCRYLRHEPLDLDECRHYLEHWTIDGVVSRRWLRLVIELEGRQVGFVSLDRRESDTAEAGWVLDPGVEGRGIGFEAAKALLELGFGELEMHRIEARPDPRNARSIRLCERLGLVREGHLREVTRVGDERRDELVFAVLLAEWRHG